MRGYGEGRRGGWTSLSRGGCGMSPSERGRESDGERDTVGRERARERAKESARERVGRRRGRGGCTGREMVSLLVDCGGEGALGVQKGCRLGRKTTFQLSTERLFSHLQAARVGWAAILSPGDGTCGMPPSGRGREGETAIERDIYCREGKSERESERERGEAGLAAALCRSAPVGAVYMYL
ncbi:hypothetical protein T484DRAFT_1890093 [Baffinella frigidus]|nr:hypothetical protein T484DRAFT_1890093 [Cryptophyta sp. CCMP2293]